MMRSSTWRILSAGSDSPGQLVGDFIRGVPSSALGEVEPSYKPGVRLGDLSTALPSYAIEAIREALPEFGKRGVQTARLRARLRRAAEAGCEIAMSLAQPGSHSQRNITKLDFRTLYTRVKFERDV